jgi:hypothetical protein
VSLSTTESTRAEVVGGDGITTIDVPPNAMFKLYYADRAAPPNGRLQAVENVMDVLVTLAYPLEKVWPIFKDFDLWQNRWGFYWDSVPANNENNIVTIVNKAGANDYKYGKEGYGKEGTRYIVRKVIPEQVIYFDALPTPLVGIDGCWTGHNVVSLREDRGQTKISFLMEHTMFSATAALDALRTELKQAITTVIGFWRDYFIPDINAAVESRLGGSSKERE